MIKFTDLAIVRGVVFTTGMIAEFDAKTEADLIREGDAEVYIVEASGTITNAINAQNAISAQTAVTAQTATTATTANFATTAGTATTATSAGTADTATNAITAVTALSANSATTAGHASTADTASTATHATTATTATAATTAEKSAALTVDGDTINVEIGRPVEALYGSAIAHASTLTATDEVLESFTIETGTIGVNSILQIEPCWSFTSSANNKILKVKVGGVTVYNSGNRTTSVKEAPLIVLANRNSLASQIQPYGSTYETASANVPATYTIDFSKDVTVEILGQRANSGDTLTLEYCRVLHFAGF